MENQKVKKTFKEKLFHEFSEYLVNFVYMAIIFSAIILYRRLVLASHGIFLEDYFLGVLKAFVIAKVVMIAAFLRTSRYFENKPLYIPVIYKAFYFTLTVMLFDIIEEFIRELIHLKAMEPAFKELVVHMNLVWLGGSMLIFFTFIPFFAFRELIRVMGQDKVYAMFINGSKKDLDLN